MARILIVDDETDLRGMFKMLFESNGYEVIEASNGNEAIELYRSSPVDLIIMDVFMPEKEGIETILELTSEFPDVNVIAISGGGKVGTRDCLDSALEFGAKRVFTKPVTADRLLRAVEQILKNGKAVPK